MTTAAVYARRSQEQSLSEDAKSVARQIGEARAFAESKGWTVAEDHIYTDGAEFADRPGLARLLLAAKSKPRPFDIVITADQDRIGRDQRFTPMVLHDLRDAGVVVWFYLTREQLRLDSPTDEIIANARNFSAAMYRHSIRLKNRGAGREKAKRGINLLCRAVDTPHRAVYSGRVACVSAMEVEHDQIPAPDHRAGSLRGERKQCADVPPAHRCARCVAICR